MAKFCTFAPGIFSPAFIFQQRWFPTAKCTWLTSNLRFEMFEHQIMGGENHRTRCRKNKNPPQKSLSDTCSSFRLPDTREHRVSRLWSGLIQSHASPPCSGGQGHPSATSTCQRRSAGEGLWCDAGGQIKGWHKQRSGVPICRAAGDPPTFRADRCHMGTHMKRARTHKLEWTVAYKKGQMPKPLLLHVDV